MSSTSAAPLVVRGSPQRKTNFMEEFQRAYLSAISAAAGCLIADFSFDDGIDAQLNHRSPVHTSLTDQTARLEIQLKATHQAPPKLGGASALMRNDRFDHFRTANPTMHKVVVVMHMPPDPADWVAANRKRLLLHHASYWVNLAGAAPSNAANPTVNAPRSNLFDDAALCAIMQRIGQGGAP